MNPITSDARQSDKPQYPNLDNVSFLILDIQFFYCIVDGKPTDRINWLHAYDLPKHDKRFMLADYHLIANWRRVTKIDYASYHIFIDHTPVWFGCLQPAFVSKLSQLGADFDAEAKTITYHQPPCVNPIKYLWSLLCGRR